MVNNLWAGHGSSKAMVDQIYTKLRQAPDAQSFVVGIAKQMKSNYGNFLLDRINEIPTGKKIKVVRRGPHWLVLQFENTGGSR